MAGGDQAVRSDPAVDGVGFGVDARPADDVAVVAAHRFDTGADFAGPFQPDRDAEQPDPADTVVAGCRPPGGRQRPPVPFAAFEGERPGLVAVGVHVDADDAVGHPQADVVRAFLHPHGDVGVGGVGAGAAGESGGRVLLGLVGQRQDAAPSGGPVAVGAVGIGVGGGHGHADGRSSVIVILVSSRDEQL